jgi:hypothetical protein
VYTNQMYKDLIHEDAFRLFPFQISTSGRIVGFWGGTEENWFDRTVNPSFVAEPRDDGWQISKFELAGYAGTGLTGLNDAGQIVGIAYATPTSRAQIFRAESLAAAPEFFTLSDKLDPFPTGISAEGVIYGEGFIVDLAQPEQCGGHGTVEDERCVCDEGFTVDPYDAKNCIEVDAVCSGHGHLHGEVCHCDGGYRTDPEDSSQCIPA